MKITNKGDILIFKKGFISKKLIKLYIIIWIVLIILFKNFQIIKELKLVLLVIKFMLAIAFCYHFNKEICILFLKEELRIDLNKKEIFIYTYGVEENIEIKEINKIVIEKTSEKSYNEISHNKLVFHLKNRELLTWGHEVNNIELENIKKIIEMEEI